jgi:hypothetical protein
MVFVGGTGGDAQAHPHYHRRENVGRRLNGVGHQRIGVTDDARKQLYEHQDRIYQQAGLRPADTPAGGAIHRSWL